MCVIIWLIQAYLLCWVLLGVFGMLAIVCLDVRASMCDFAAWVRRKLH